MPTIQYYTLIILKIDVNNTLTDIQSGDIYAAASYS